MNDAKPHWCESLYEAKAAQLVLYGRALGLSHSEAEDVLQETFMAFLQQDTPPEKPEHYCLRSFRNRALNYRRGLWRRLTRELEKIRRKVGERIPGAPHEVLLVLDATAGQNAIAQAEAFKKTIACTGIILAKLDGTAKGGAIFGIKKKLDLPVKFVGVGEKVDDLEVFDPEEYVEKLFEA